VTVEVTNQLPSEQVIPLAPKPSGVGLIALRERVELIGGTFAAGPVGPSSWQVSAHFSNKQAGHV